MRRQRAMPAVLPGDYCVVIRQDDSYTLILNDRDSSSYLLGENMQEITRALSGYRPDDLLLRTVDVAREFGMAQAVFKNQRVVPLHGRVKQPRIDFAEFDAQEEIQKPSFLPNLG